MGAAKKLADATTRMIEAAKSCASSPHDFEQQMQLKTAAEDVRVATSAAAQDQLRRAAILKLEVSISSSVMSRDVLKLSYPFDVLNVNCDIYFYSKLSNKL